MAARKLTYHQLQVRWAWIFLLPSVLVIVMVAGFPLARTIWLSFTDATLDNLDDVAFIGIDQYVYLFSDPVWWTSVWNTLVFTVCSVVTETILGLMVALLLNQQFKGRGILRAAVLIPWAIPTVVSSQIWAWLYHDQFGVINDALAKLGFIDPSDPIAFMGSANLVLPAIIAVDVWKTTPFMALLLLAGLGTIPTSVLEAAKIDGATRIQSFFKITLPLLMPALLIALIFRTLDAFRVFDIIYVMQGSNEKAMSVSIYARQQMVDFQEIALGSSASFAIFVIISLFTAGYMLLVKVDVNR